MELKLFKLAILMQPLVRFNRTFMELKCVYGIWECAPTFVLIVPLWN